MTFSTARSAVNGTLDRVVLYVQNNGAGNLLGGDITISTPTANGLRFFVSDTDGDDVPDSPQIYTTPGSSPATQTRTRVDNQLFSTPVTVTPATTWADRVRSARSA